MRLMLEWEEKYFVLVYVQQKLYFLIIIINIFFVVVVMFQNRQVMVTSLGCYWYSGCAPI